MLGTSVYRQNAKTSIYWIMLNAKDLDKLIGKNLKRIRLKAELTQDKLGEMIGVDGVVIAQIEGAIRGMGKVVMSRLCKALNVYPYEFYIDNDTPVAYDEIEKETLFTLREAKKLGVAEEIPKYGKYLIQEIKKTKKVPGEGKALRYKAVKRR